MDIAALTLLRRSIKPRTGAILIAAILLVDSAIAAAPYMDSRLPTKEDVREAYNALIELLPDDYSAYTKMQRGNTLPHFGKYVLFFTDVPDNRDQVRRIQQVRCSPVNKAWKCSIPTIQVSYRHHRFPEPPGIDNETITEILDFLDSSCASNQRRRLIEEQASRVRPRLGAPISPASLPVREMSTAASGFRVTVGIGGTGHSFSLTRPVDPNAECGFQLELTGAYISQVPNRRIDIDHFAAGHAGR